MPTCRTVIKDALRALKVIGSGDMAHVDQLNAGLSALQNLVVEFHEARGPLVDVDVTADYVANENQRVRVQAGDTVDITLPNSIPVWGAFDPYDYGFTGTPSWLASGSTGEADGFSFRAPTDWARIEVVGTTQGLWFYRADINSWMSAYALTLDTEIPLNARYAGPLGALLAERLIEELSLNEPSPGFARRAVMARAALFLRTGSRRRPVRAEYL
ncbi:MAG TPA: hypothetical protein VGI30_09950 [Caulobacteraceae bacterium]